MMGLKQVLQEKLHVLRGFPPGFRPYLSWTGMAWDDYLRQRWWGKGLQTLRCPSVPGLVSVVLPVFNGAGFLTEAIESVRRQTWREWELIIVNDGSTDASPEIADSHCGKDSRIRVIHQENRKLPRALNAGFQVARGEFLTWTSADNRLKPPCLARLVEALREDPSADMVYADYEMIREGGGFSHLVHLSPDTARLNLLSGNYVGPAFLYRDRVAHLHGDYSPHRFTVEDYDFAMRVNEVFTLRHVPGDEPLYEYRLHGGALSAQGKELRIQERSEELVAFDSARRKLLLGSMRWFLGGNTEKASEFRKVLQDYQGADRDLAVFWEETAPACRHSRFPDVALWFGGPQDARPACRHSRFPEGYLLKVLLWDSPDPLPAEVHSDWDCCLSLGARDLPRLPRPWQGWYAVENLEAVIEVAGLRARLEASRRMEEAAVPEEGTGVSLVVWGNGDSAILPEILQRACSQKPPLGGLEILLALEEVTPEVEQAVSGKPVKILGGEKGQENLLNRALWESRGAVLAFLDEHTIPSESLATSVEEAFRSNPELGVLLLSEKEFSFPPVGAEMPGHLAWSARRKDLLRLGGIQGFEGLPSAPGVRTALRLERLQRGIASEPGKVEVRGARPLMRLAKGDFTWELMRDLLLPKPSWLEGFLFRAELRLGGKVLKRELSRFRRPRNLPPRR